MRWDVDHSQVLVQVLLKYGTITYLEDKLPTLISFKAQRDMKNRKIVKKNWNHWDFSAVIRLQRRHQVGVKSASSISDYDITLNVLECLYHHILSYNFYSSINSSLSLSQPTQLFKFLTLCKPSILTCFYTFSWNKNINLFLHLLPIYIMHAWDSCF